MASNKKQRDELDREFESADLIEVMRTGSGRRFVALVLELCGYEESAMANNATHIASNVAKQEVAHTLKTICWVGGGKALWRKMEDEIELKIDAIESGETPADDDDYDFENSLESDNVH